MSAYFSATSLEFPALRAHTSNRYWPGVTGVHARLVAALHSCNTVHPVASNIHHLNCRGAVPPVAAAVSVIVVPAGCGDAGFAVSVTAVTGALTTPYRCSAHFPSTSLEFPALRAHTSNRYWAGVAGVHGRLVAAFHSCNTVHP